MLGTVGVDPITLGFFAEDGDCFFFSMDFGKTPMFNPAFLP